MPINEKCFRPLSDKTSLSCVERAVAPEQVAAVAPEQAAAVALEQAAAADQSAAAAKNAETWGITDK
jgi:hypothetical protein